MREKHLFQFTAKQISEAAGTEAKYHEDRASHWNTRYEAAVTKAKSSTVRIQEYDVTGGKQARIMFDDEAALEIDLACRKRDQHNRDAMAFRVEEACYGSQGDHVYELSGDDVMHFRLAGGTREE